jgi:hypothetical protein
VNQDDAAGPNVTGDVADNLQVGSGTPSEMVERLAEYVEQESRDEASDLAKEIWMLTANLGTEAESASSPSKPVKGDQHQTHEVMTARARLAEMGAYVRFYGAA